MTVLAVVAALAQPPRQPISSTSESTQASSSASQESSGPAGEGLWGRLAAWLGIDSPTRAAPARLVAEEGPSRIPGAESGVPRREAAPPGRRRLRRSGCGS
ncbi:hypothetical protein [Actinopolymorpha sp. B9G3]|uniref:hypothetical protein n=1 Tax=Actinopolymorpha sp. B9G3 TaxID=3158970 RepID=UPI0032D8EAAF